MAGRKGGMAPLGDKPMGKVHLEGPKKHHDMHGKHDSVPGHSQMHAEHWERKYNATGASRNMKATEGADFNAECPSDRKTTHIKVNREDH